MTPQAQTLITLFETNRTERYGVNVQAVIDALTAQGKDPAVEFESLFRDRDPEAMGGYYYAMTGMRSLAVRGLLTQAQARIVLKMMVSPMLQLDGDGYYKTISALARSRETAPALLEFTEQTLEKKAVSRWRWWAFYAASELLGAGTAPLPQTLVEKLLQEIPEERDPHDKHYFEEVMRGATKSS